MSKIQFLASKATGSRAILSFVANLSLYEEMGHRYIGSFGIVIYIHLRVYVYMSGEPDLSPV